MRPHRIGERQHVPVLDKRVLRSKIDARTRVDGRRIRERHTVVPAPPRDQVAGRTNSLRGQRTSDCFCRDARTECLHDRRSECL